MPGMNGPPGPKDHQHMSKHYRSLAASCLLAAVASLSASCTAPVEMGYLDRYTIAGAENYLTGYPAVNDDGTVNVVIEIPAGSNEKWEVDKRDGLLRWEQEQGRPRVVAYVGYPGNYGMVPRTLLPAELGGDGDPVDVLVIGQRVERGRIQRCRIIGVLGLLDRGEVDDKLLAVAEGNALSDLRNLEQLDARFPGVRVIVETWFANYKGPGKMVVQDWSGPEEAQRILAEAVRAYDQTAGS